MVDPTTPAPPRSSPGRLLGRSQRATYRSGSLQKVDFDLDAVRALDIEAGGACPNRRIQEPLMADLHHYGTASQAKLMTCHDDLVLVMTEALKMTPPSIDITIVHGFRDKPTQNGIDPRFTTKRWPASYHNAEDEDGEPCSDAIDFAPFITLRSGKKGIPWTDVKLFSYVAGIIQAAAHELKIEITWGGDFDRDGSTEDQTLADVGHIQRTNAARRPPAED